MLDGLTIDPVAFTIPIGDGFPIYWYGILVTVGIALGALWGAREAAKRGLNVDEFFNGLIIVVLSGYIFARLTYVLLEVFAGRGDQFDSLMSIVNIRQGGINILGGFIGAAVIGYLYLRWRNLDFWQYADVAGPSLLLAQSIGRFGNFINQELYGPPTDLPWGILIDAQHRLPQFSDLSQYPLDTRFHPTFLYESLWLFLGFLVLAYLSSRYRDCVAPRRPVWHLPHLVGRRPIRHRVLPPGSGDHRHFADYLLDDHVASARWRRYLGHHVTQPQADQ